MAALKVDETIAEVGRKFRGRKSKSRQGIFFDMRVEYLSIQVPDRTLVVWECISYPASPSSTSSHRPLSSSKFTRMQYESCFDPFYGSPRNTSSSGLSKANVEIQT